MTWASKCSQIADRKELLMMRSSSDSDEIVHLMVPSVKEIEIDVESIKITEGRYPEPVRKGL
jgi:hypothetical protein